MHLSADIASVFAPIGAIDDLLFGEGAAGNTLWAASRVARGAGTRCTLLLQMKVEGSFHSCDGTESPARPALALVFDADKDSLCCVFIQ